MKIAIGTKQNFKEGLINTPRATIPISTNMYPQQRYKNSRTTVNQVSVPLRRLFDDEGGDVVAGELVVLGVRPVAVGELLALPAAAEHSLKTSVNIQIIYNIHHIIFMKYYLVSQVLDLDGVDHLGVVEFDLVVDPGRLEARHLAHGVLKFRL